MTNWKPSGVIFYREANKETAAALHPEEEDGDDGTSDGDTEEETDFESEDGEEERELDEEATDEEVDDDEDSDDDFVLCDLNEGLKLQVQFIPDDLVPIFHEQKHWNCKYTTV